MQTSDIWKKTGRWSWNLESPALDGSASIKEVEGGYKAALTVKDLDFGMSLKEIEEFFESRRKAEAFLAERMDEAVSAE